MIHAEGQVRGIVHLVSALVELGPDDRARLQRHQAAAERWIPDLTSTFYGRLFALASSFGKLTTVVSALIAEGQTL